MHLLYYKMKAEIKREREREIGRYLSCLKDIPTKVSFDLLLVQISKVPSGVDDILKYS